MGQGHGATGEESVQCQAQITAVDRFSVSWTAGIELAGVGQRSRLIQNEEIRGAGGMPRLGDLLRSIHEVGEVPPPRLGKSGHFGRRIVRVLGGVVRVDGEERNSFGLVLPSHTTEGLADMEDVGAVVADKKDDGDTSRRKVGRGK